MFNNVPMKEVENISSITKSVIKTTQLRGPTAEQEQWLHLRMTIDSLTKLEAKRDKLLETAMKNSRTDLSDPQIRLFINEANAYNTALQILRGQL